MCHEPTDEPSIRTAAEEDAVYQRAVFAAVLEIHPTQVTEAELVRKVALDPEDFPTRDGIKRAVRDLAGAGLLHRNGDFVLRRRQPSASRSFGAWWPDAAQSHRGAVRGEPAGCPRSFRAAPGDTRRSCLVAPDGDRTAGAWRADAPNRHGGQTRGRPGSVAGRLAERDRVGVRQRRRGQLLNQMSALHPVGVRFGENIRRYRKAAGWSQEALPCGPTPHLQRDSGAG